MPDLLTSIGLALFFGFVAFIYSLIFPPLALVFYLLAEDTMEPYQKMVFLLSWTIGTALWVAGVLESVEENCKKLMEETRNCKETQKVKQ